MPVCVVGAGSEEEGLYEDPNGIRSGPYSDDFIEPYIYFFRGPLSKYSHTEGEAFSIEILGGHRHLIHTRMCLWLSPD